MGVISGLTKEIAPPIYGALNRIIQKARDMGFGDKIYYHSTTAKKDFDEFSDVGTGSNDLGYHFGTSQAASERNNNLINNKLRNLFNENPERFKKLNMNYEKMGEGSRTFPVKLKANNPLYLEENRTGEWKARDILKQIEKKIDSDLSSNNTFGNMTEKEMEDFLSGDYKLNNVMRDDAINYKAESNEYMGEDWGINEWTKDFLEKNGFDSIKYTNIVEDAGSESVIVLRPNQIRMPWASFDPEKAKSGKLLASAAPVAVSLGALSDLKEEPQ